MVTEILQGIKKDEDFERVKGYLLEFPVQRPKGTETYLKAAEIFRACSKKGRTVMKTVDCIIAAICIEKNLPLFHKDSYFDAIEEYAGLEVLEVQ